MPTQVCAVCGGDNPGCLACRGSGVDRPPSYHAIPYAIDREILHAMEDLTDETNELMNLRTRLIVTDIHRWLRELVWAGALLLVVVVGLVYLLFTHDSASWVSLALVVTVIAGGATSMSARIAMMEVNDPFLARREDE